MASRSRSATACGSEREISGAANRGVEPQEIEKARLTGARAGPGADASRRMLNKLDDYPIHQTPEPVAHTLGGDRNAYDRYWFNGFTREADLFFAVALGLYRTGVPSERAGGWVGGFLATVMRDALGASGSTVVLGAVGPWFG